MYDIRPTVLHAPLDGRLFTLAGLAKRTGRHRVRSAAVRRTQSNRTRRSAAGLAFAAEFSVAADADVGLLLAKVCVVISEQLLDQLLHRIPSLADVEPQELRSWTESFTPDGKYIMGPAPEVGFCIIFSALTLLVGHQEERLACKI